MVHIVERLREDHERIGGLFQRMRQQTDGSAERRGNLARALGYELSAHAAFEEAVFYPAVREGDDVTQLVAEAVSELHAAEDIVERLQEMEPASAEFTQTLGELEAAVVEHLRREEDEIFPLALKVIGRDEAEEMSERHEAMARGHV